MERENHEHAPAPWEYVPIERDEDDVVYNVASVRARPEGGQAITGVADVWEEANARLIAAAPELLEAATLAFANLEPAYSSDHLVIRSLRAAIAKATGQL